jgi:hypothetical protein
LISNSYKKSRLAWDLHKASGRGDFMPMPIASLPPATNPIPVESDSEDQPPYAGTMEFSELWQDHGQPTFLDLLDIINPLQHIPVISTIYRNLTGDEIGLAARLIGGGLFGGAFGLANAIATMAVEEATGQDPSTHIFTAIQEFFDPAEESAAAAEPQVAQGAPSPAETAPPVPAARPPVQDAADKPDPAPDPAPGPVQSGTAPATVETSAPLSFLPQPAHLARPAPFAPAPAPFAPATAGAPSVQHAPGRPMRSAALPATGASSEIAAERARITRNILAAQQAQARLLLAGIVADQRLQTEQPQARDGEDNEPGTPFLQHPNLLPSGASPQWFGHAMGRALDKYQQANLLRGSATALPTPLPTLRR